MLDRPPRILLVDDEQSIQTLLSYPLRKDGYEVVQANDGREALARFGESTFDLVVLDVMMPRLDGLEVCRRLRSRSSVPIIMLTAKAEEIDKVLGLELGADDYITKPFSLREFRSRVKAALRRGGMARRDSVTDEEPLDVHELRIDFAKRSVRVRGEEVQTTYVEFEILTALATNPGRVWTRDMLLDADLGRQRLPRPAHDRRPHPSPAREARARRQGAGVPLHRARSRLPVPRHGGVTPLRSLTLRLALPFCAIVIAAIAIVYLGVAPSLESSLRDQRLDTLAESAQRYGPGIRRALDASVPANVLDNRVRRANDDSGARVTLLAVQRTDRGGPRLEVRSDSNTSPRISDLQFGVAERAVRSGRIERGTEAGDAGRVAEAAVPLRITPPRSQRAGIYYVAVFSQQLEGIQRGVELIRQRILVAGGDRAGARDPRQRARRELGLAPREADGARRAPGRPGRLHRALRRLGPRRARPARADARRDAAPARRARDRAQPLHRDGLARAAHADLLDRRIPRAARGRGARRGDAGDVHPPGPRAGRPARPARDRPPRPLQARGRIARAAPRAHGPARDRPRRRGRVRAGARGPRIAPRAAPRGRPSPRPTATRSGWRRSCVSSSTTR